MKYKILSLVLAAVLALGLVSPAMAYSTPDFADLPADNWAYEPVMRMADQGVIQGTGNGMFSPEMKVSVAQFLTLVGRIVFPNTTVGVGDTWYGPYMAAAQAGGLLTGTQVDVNQPEAEISRYDMAVILRAAAKKLGKAETLAQQSQVTDFGMIPNMYTEAVLAVYGMGLIKGDQAGNFNGSNTMMRAEVATVIMRLAKAKPGDGSQGGVAGPQPTEQPKDATYHLKLYGTVVEKGTLVVGERVSIGCKTEPNAAGLANAPYGLDQSGFSCASSEPSIVQAEYTPDGRGWFLTALSLGTSTITLTDPYGVSTSLDITVVSKRDNVATKAYTVCVRPACYEEHNIRGNAYTRTTTVPDVAYKLYHTRDGGKTAQLVYEGVAPSEGGSGTLLEVELPEDAFFSKDAGFYISAEAVVEGQRMVTSDLRTDGRAHVTLVQNIWPTWVDGERFDTYEMKLKLTPPEGEKSHFTFKGYVLAGRWGERIGDATIQLYLEDGTLIGETASKADGTFEMECEVDALDDGFNKRKELYRIVAWGYASDGYCGTNSPRWSLVDLKIAPALDRDGPGDGNYRLYLLPQAQPVTD